MRVKLIATIWNHEMGEGFEVLAKQIEQLGYVLQADGRWRYRIEQQEPEEESQKRAGTYEPPTAKEDLAEQEVGPRIQEQEPTKTEVTK